MSYTLKYCLTYGIIMSYKDIVLTGDRPSGPLHLGHLVGSLQNRVVLQNQYKQYVMIADVQALTDNFEQPEKVRKHVFEVVLDYLAVGIDPIKSTIFVQSMIPEIAELTVFYLNLVTVSRLKRNPTVKAEMQQKQYGDTVPAGFLMYPVSQAADITIVKGTLVPVGEDQLPMIEQANELVRSFNRIYGDTFCEIKPILGSAPRLPGIDGKAKMSKSLGNAIYLSDAADVVVKKIMSMYTDPSHFHVHDPGKVEGNTVFAYLDIFDSRTDEVAALKEHYQRGGLGDVVLKRRLIEVLETGILAPIRTKREYLTQHMDHIADIVRRGTQHAQEAAAHTMREVKVGMKLDY